MNEHETAEKIHDAASDLLEAPGIKLDHDEICKMLLDAGAKQGASTHVVRIPKELVDEKIALCPKEFIFADREGNGPLVGSESDAVIWSVPGLKIFENNTVRAFTQDDMARAARLLDQLANVDAVFGLALDDVPPRARDVMGLRIMAGNTSKHIRVLCFTPEGSDMMTEMKEVIGDYPWFSVGFTAHGPLRWTNLALEIFKRSAGHGIPTTINGEPMAGVSGPVTLAGSAAVGTAEILAGLVINQMLEPGRPCVFNLGLAHTFDMRTSIAVTGGPENHLFAGIAAMMGRFYNLPSASWVSTESMEDHKRFKFSSRIDLQTELNQMGVDLPLLEDTKALKQPLRLGKKIIPNRMVIHPMEGCDGDEKGRPGKLTLEDIYRIVIGYSTLCH